MKNMFWWVWKCLFNDWGWTKKKIGKFIIYVERMNEIENCSFFFFIIIFYLFVCWNHKQKSNTFNGFITVHVDQKKRKINNWQYYLLNCDERIYLKWFVYKARFDV